MMRASLRRGLMVLELLSIHLPNIIIVGLCHLDYKITAASALTQIPSFYLFFYLIARASCFPPKEPPEPPGQEQLSAEGGRVAEGAGREGAVC